VNFDDLTRLDEDEFLNDQLIDFYMLYLFDQMNVPPNRVYIFNTHFFSTLTRKVPGQKNSINYSAVARWTSKEDLFGYDYIVIPINQE
jgi:sentrin-specific protease 7